MMDVQYQVFANADRVYSHDKITNAINSYDRIGELQEKALGYAYGDRAGLLMARDNQGRDVTMRHEIPGRDLVVPEIKGALDKVEQHLHAQDLEQDFSDPLIGEGVPFERIRRITGYLVGSLDRFNNAKRAEVVDRVKHKFVESQPRMMDQMAKAQEYARHDQYQENPASNLER